MLISEAGGHNKQKKSKEESKKNTSSFKDKDVTSDSDSHVEMDSRFLSTLLNVSYLAFVSVLYVFWVHLSAS